MELYKIFSFLFFYFQRYEFVIQQLNATTKTISFLFNVSSYSDKTQQFWKLRCSNLERETKSLIHCSSSFTPDVQGNFDNSGLDLLIGRCENLIPGLTYRIIVENSNINAQIIEKSTTEPLPVVNLNQRTFNHSSVWISWLIPNCTLFERYRVYWGQQTRSAAYKEWFKIPQKQTFMLINKPIGKNLIFQIQTMSSGKFSKIEIIPLTGKAEQPSPPRDLQVEMNGFDRVRLSWIPPLYPRGIITKYELEMCKSQPNYLTPTCVALTLKDSLNLQTSWNNLKSGVIYNCSIKAFTEAGEGHRSKSVVFKVPGVILDMLVDSMTSESIHLSWKVPVKWLSYVCLINYTSTKLKDSSIIGVKNANTINITNLKAETSYNFLINCSSMSVNESGNDAILSQKIKSKPSTMLHHMTWCRNNISSITINWDLQKANANLFKSEAIVVHLIKTKMNKCHAAFVLRCKVCNILDVFNESYAPLVIDHHPAIVDLSNQCNKKFHIKTTLTPMKGVLKWSIVNLDHSVSYHLEVRIYSITDKKFVGDKISFEIRALHSAYEVYYAVPVLIVILIAACVVVRQIYLRKRRKFPEINEPSIKYNKESESLSGGVWGEKENDPQESNKI